MLQIVLFYFCVAHVVFKFDYSILGLGLSLVSGLSLVGKVSLTSLLCTMMHSIHIGQCPTYSNNLVRSVAASSTRSRWPSADAAQQPQCRKAIVKWAFSYASPRAWNALPLLLHTITDSKQFSSS